MSQISLDDNPWGVSPSPLPATAPPPETPPTLSLDTEDEPTAFGWDSAPAVEAPPTPEHEPPSGKAEVADVPAEQDGRTESEEAIPAVEGTGEAEESPSEQHDEVTTTHVTSAPPVASPEPIRTESPPMDDFEEEPLTPVATSAPVMPSFDSFDDADAFDEDDDFGELGGDDDDFGDFDEGDVSAFGAVPPMVSFAAAVASTSAAAYPALRLDLTTPTGAALAPQLAPFFQSRYPLATDSLSDEPERQVDGVGQVLVTESTRALLATLSSLPPLRPLDWRRSKIRREHLIALGVPVNLDDSADTKPLASLVLPSQQANRLNSFSGPNSAPARSSSPLPFSTPSRSSTPTADSRTRSSPLPPPLDKQRAAQVCDIAEDDLLLLSLVELERLKAEIESISKEASGALTHALLVREKEVTDGETYHGMIQDLVTAAARMKTTSVSRSGAGSPVGRPLSGSRWGRKASGNTTSAVR